MHEQRKFFETSTGRALSTRLFAAVALCLSTAFFAHSALGEKIEITDTMKIRGTKKTASTAAPPAEPGRNSKASGKIKDPAAGKNPSMTADECATAVAGIAKGSQSIAALTWPRARRMAREIATCHAVATNSDAPCQALRGRAKDECSNTITLMADLRAKSTGRSFLFSEKDYQRCKGVEEFSDSCDAIRLAANSGDTRKCPTGILHDYCAAYVGLDVALCDKVKQPVGAAKECKRLIRSLGPYASGLRKAAESGPHPQQIYARAALGHKDACTALSESAITACTGTLQKRKVGRMKKVGTPGPIEKQGDEKDARDEDSPKAKTKSEEIAAE